MYDISRCICEAELISYLCHCNSKSRQDAKMSAAAMKNALTICLQKHFKQCLFKYSGLQWPTFPYKLVNNEKMKICFGETAASHVKLNDCLVLFVFFLLFLFPALPDHSYMYSARLACERDFFHVP